MTSKKGESAFDQVTSDNTETTTASDSDTEESESPPSDDTQSPADISKSEPSLPFNTVTQRPIYISDSAWENHDDLRFETKRILRSEYNVKNVQARELDEAIFSILTDVIPPELVAAQLVRHRGFTPNDEHTR